MNRYKANAAVRYAFGLSGTGRLGQPYVELVDALARGDMQYDSEGDFSWVSSRA